MRPYLITLACLYSVLAFVTAVPVPASNQELDVLQIPLSNGKELDVLTLGARDQEQIIAERNKRTIGLLRELFPDLTKTIDDIVNRIIAQVIRAVGPEVVRGLFNNRGNTTPRTFIDADFDDDDDDEDDDDVGSNNSIDNESKSSTTTTTTEGNDARVKIDLPTFAPETADKSNNGATDTQIDLSAINKQLEETIRVARQVKEAEAAAAAAAVFQNAAEKQNQPAQLPIPSSKVEETIQLSFNNELTSNDSPKSISNDLQLSESKSPAIDELSLDSNEDTADLDDRNKRFLQFGGAGLAGGASSSSSSGSSSGSGAGGAGSGNFLFDIVRLFSGSVQTQAGDEAANSANSVSSSSDSDSESQRGNDGYTEGIPGPVTRLVVLANRGLANLVQDLILRVAATSEKFVNFKAKLITALI
ncbi:uncharacterized protein LOC142231651 [Haematobia irritans]|uniref:uncharacterized protein LOC142231651 n=1 Tax=Haematobia irritans TaxID=7368 RepID=UPI003F504733